jgi:NAD(P)-dependent dehydrogenase (short-subunit alcohol dehydrogenase family)
MSARHQEFKDKTVLITGAGRGIGKRLAMGFAAEGARVGLLARSKAELDLTHLEIEHAGGAALRLRADVRDADQVTRAVDLLHARFGEIDVLICAAGLQGPIGPFLENTQTDWVDALQTNVAGVMRCCAAALPDMVRRRGGKVIAVGGGGGSRPRPNFSAYAASKAALVRFIETLAEELRDHNVQLNCMAPGGTYTHMTDQILAAGEKAGWKDHQDAMQIRLTGGTPPQKQLALAMFLASERSNHVSGKLLHVDDNWRRLLHGNVNQEIYTLRRVQRV